MLPPLLTPVTPTKRTAKQSHSRLLLLPLIWIVNSCNARQWRWLSLHIAGMDRISFDFKLCIKLCLYCVRCWRFCALIDCERGNREANVKKKVEKNGNLEREREKKNKITWLMMKRRSFVSQIINISPRYRIAVVLFPFHLHNNRYLCIRILESKS